MRESQSTVERWVNEKAAEGFDFMFVVCDTFDYEQYPVGVRASEFWGKYDHYNGPNMQRIEGFFDLSTKQTLITFPPKPAPAPAKSPEHEALEEVRKALLDPENEHVASRANRALNIIDKALGESK